MMPVIKGSDSWIRTQLAIGEMECVLVGAAHTAGTATVYAAGGAAVGGATGALVGATVGGIAGVPGGPAGVVAGATQGAALGFDIGTKIGAGLGASYGVCGGTLYTAKICANYLQQCKALREFEGNEAEFERVGATVKEIIRQFFENFYYKQDEEVRIVCPISSEIMLYPAKITKCAMSHVYALSSIHAILKSQEGRATCPECRVSFNEMDVRICCDTHDAMLKVVNKSFDYLRSMKTNALLVRQLNEEIGYNLWQYLGAHPLAPLSPEIEKKIFDRASLSIEETRTVYPAFLSLCDDLEAVSDAMRGELLFTAKVQLRSGKIDKDQHDNLCREIKLLAKKNKTNFFVLDNKA